VGVVFNDFFNEIQQTWFVGHIESVSGQFSIASEAKSDSNAMR
jgi:hypothetical protein